MKSIIIRLITLSLSVTGLVSLNSCTKYNVIETGLANGVHEKSMNDYFSEDPDNWALTQQLIKRAGLESTFSATNTNGPGITFLGITDPSILRYLSRLQKKENEAAKDESREAKTITIEDISPDDARQMILNCVIPKRIMLKDIPRGVASSDKNQFIGTGGMTVTTLGGTKLWLSTFQEDFLGVLRSGAVSIYVASENTIKAKKTDSNEEAGIAAGAEDSDKGKEATQNRIRIASSDIQTLTGIVHSLPYGAYTLGDL